MKAGIPMPRNNPYNQEDPSLRSLYAALREDQPDDLSRRRLRARVLSSLRARPIRPEPLRSWKLLSAGLAAAAAVTIVAGLWFYQGLRGGSQDPELNVYANGGIHLRWTDVGKRRYRILRSTNPADFSGAESATVRGTAYVDSSPSEAPIIYYRVE